MATAPKKNDPDYVHNDRSTPPIEKNRSDFTKNNDSFDFKQFKQQAHQNFNNEDENKNAVERDQLAEAYLILGLSSTATDREVKQQYSALALAHHPDKTSSLPDANQHTELFKKINDAYMTIKNSRSANEESTHYDESNGNTPRLC